MSTKSHVTKVNDSMSDINIADNIQNIMTHHTQGLILIVTSLCHA